MLRVLTYVVVIVLLLPVVSLAGVGIARQGQCEAVLSLEDGSPVALERVWVDLMAGVYALVRDPAAGGPILPVLIYSQLEPWSTVDITGYMATVDGRRVVVATSVLLYTDSKGRPSPPLPQGLEWPWTENISVGVTTSVATMATTSLPSVPEPNILLEDPQPLTALPGTIAYAKLNGGMVTLSGKIVTGVYYDTASSAILFIYVQEPDCPSGIKVILPANAIVNTRDVVTVSGSVGVDSATGECQITATSITKTGTAPMPKPLGMPQRAMAGGEFGLQPASYTTPTVQGAGLNPTGMRARVWGHWLSTLTENGRQVCYIDDGSGLSRTGHTGMKVIYYHGDPGPIPSNGMLCVTGILGVEKDGDNPMPVLRAEPYRVGFLYDLCYPSLRRSTDTYLVRIDEKYGDVSYGRISDFASGINGSFNVVIVSLPGRDLTTSELNALLSFVQSGREKRVVLVGEWNYAFAPYNARLNAVASAIGMLTRFTVGGAGNYDVNPLYWTCPVDGTHYLLPGVTHLWDAGTDVFAPGWQSYARGLAFLPVNEDPYRMKPWILEEDTTTSGSRIAVHDSNLFDVDYYCDADTVPDKNFRFIYNMCTIFPQ